MTTAYDDQDLTHTEPVEFNKQYISTTVGRAILNDALPEGMPYVNGLLKKKGIGQLVNYCYLNLGLEVTVKTLDRIKDLGFHYATTVRSLRRPRRHGHPRVQVHRSCATPKSRRSPCSSSTSTAPSPTASAPTRSSRCGPAVTERVADEMFNNMKRADKEGAMNPIYIMADSGARGSKQQIRQLSGMRGLMAKPSGEIIETPITANFREGLTVLAVLHLDPRRA